MNPGTTAISPLRFIDLGRADYRTAYDAQLHHHTQVLVARERGQPSVGVVLFVEHDPPVITVTRRPGTAAHLLASPDHLASLGVSLHHTDRGGDITYHGPGQLVAYPIIDLASLNMALHPYIRALEHAVIDTCAHFSVAAHRDEGATGVWVTPDSPPHTPAKIAAIGVRVKRWITMHGLALNVSTNLDHFNLIVPCGLHGRPVTSLRQLLHDRAPHLAAVRDALAPRLASALTTASSTPS